MGILLLFFWAMNSTPIDSETPNVLRNGLAAWSAKGDGIVDALHPVQAAERKALRNTIQAEREAARAAHGDQFVLKLRMEQSIVTQAPRFPTQAPSQVALECLLGIDEQAGIGFCNAARAQDRAQPPSKQFIHEELEGRN